MIFLQWKGHFEAGKKRLKNFLFIPNGVTLPFGFCNAVSLQLINTLLLPYYIMQCLIKERQKLRIMLFSLTLKSALWRRKICNEFSWFAVKYSRNLVVHKPARRRHTVIRKFWIKSKN